jgi:hypothetical protein
MPRYFFHVYEHGIRVECDALGISTSSELAGEDCARIVKEVLHAAEWKELLQLGREFRVFDEAERPVCSISFDAHDEAWVYQESLLKC